MKKKNKVSLFLDSGAFSAWSKGIEINLQEYIDFIKKHKKYIDVYACLDVIGDPEQTYENQLEMEKQGLNPMICFHNGEDHKWLELYLEKYDYVALGGIASGVPYRTVQKHLDRCWDIICDTKDRIPKHKIHGFGLTSLPLMLRYPWYSVDSTSWVLTGRFGSVFVPKKKNNKYVYDENSWKVTVSSKSPSKKEAGKHIDTFSNMEKDRILEYFDYKGYKLGKSEYFVANAKEYKPDRENGESWLNKEVDSDGNREVEEVIEPGLSNDYKQRDELNIIYFLDLEKSMPKWPWAFKLRRQKGFGMSRL